MFFSKVEHRIINPMVLVCHQVVQTDDFCSISRNVTSLSVRQKVRQLAVDTGLLVISGSTC